MKETSIDTARKALILARPGDPRSDDLGLAVTLAIEGRTSSVRTITECLDVGAEELLRKAGCDSIVCLSRFEAQFLSSEMVNPGVQDVILDLLSHLDGQQFYFTSVAGLGKTFGAVGAHCKAQGHLAMGLRRNKKPMLNLATEFAVEPDDAVITIGAKPLR